MLIEMLPEKVRSRAKDFILEHRIEKCERLEGWGMLYESNGMLKKAVGYYIKALRKSEHIGDQNLRNRLILSVSNTFDSIGRESETYAKERPHQSAEKWMRVKACESFSNAALYLNMLNDSSFERKELMLLLRAEENMCMLPQFTQRRSIQDGFLNSWAGARLYELRRKGTGTRS